jgi:hypothetical protein
MPEPLALETVKEKLLALSLQLGSANPPRRRSARRATRTLVFQLSLRQPDCQSSDTDAVWGPGPQQNSRVSRC